MKLKRHINFINESNEELESLIDSNLLEIIKKASEILGEYEIKDKDTYTEVIFNDIKYIKIFFIIQNEDTEWKTGIAMYDGYAGIIDATTDNYEEFINLIYKFMFDLYTEVKKYKNSSMQNPEYSDYEQEELYGSIIIPEVFLNSNYFKSKKSISKFNL